ASTPSSKTSRSSVSPRPTPRCVASWPWRSRSPPEGWTGGPVGPPPVPAVRHRIQGFRGVVRGTPLAFSPTEGAEIAREGESHDRSKDRIRHFVPVVRFRLRRRREERKPVRRKRPHDREDRGRRRKREAALL